MASNSSYSDSLLPACRELLKSHPDSLHIREQVEALEAAMPDQPGIVVSFCRTLIETTCKTILSDRGVPLDTGWEAPKLVSETLKFLNIGMNDGTQADKKLQSGAESLVRGVNQITDGIMMIRNAYGSAAHGTDAYAPILDVRYAEIIARSTDAVIGLLFQVHFSAAQYDPLLRFRYGDHPDFDERIDDEFGPFSILETELIASEVLFKTDFKAYRSALVQFRQEKLLPTTNGETGETE